MFMALLPADACGWGDRLKMGGKHASYEGNLSDCLVNMGHKKTDFASLGKPNIHNETLAVIKLAGPF